MATLEAPSFSPFVFLESFNRILALQSGCRAKNHSSRIVVVLHSLKQSTRTNIPKFLHWRLTKGDPFNKNGTKIHSSHEKSTFLQPTFFVPLCTMCITLVHFSKYSSPRQTNERRMTKSTIIEFPFLFKKAIKTASRKVGCSMFAVC